jgi:tetratricopeptide (TPR) repeat protein
LLMEIALTHNSSAAYDASYVNTAKLFMTLAHDLAAKCRDYPLLGKIQGNFGRIYHQMGVNRDMDQQISIETATPYFLDAIELFKIENNIESIIGATFKLGPCLIALRDYKGAVEYYQQAAWYARASAYQDKAWNLRLLLGLAAATAGFLVFVRKDKGTTIEEVLNTGQLESINALGMVRKCGQLALDFHREGRGAHT